MNRAGTIKDKLLEILRILKLQDNESSIGVSQLLKEVMLTDKLQEFIELTNEKILRSFRLHLEMDEYE